MVSISMLDTSNSWVKLELARMVALDCARRMRKFHRRYIDGVMVVCSEKEFARWHADFNSVVNYIEYVPAFTLCPTLTHPEPLTR